MSKQGMNKVYEDACNALAIAEFALGCYRSGVKFTTYEAARNSGMSAPTARKHLIRLQTELKVLSHTRLPHWSGNSDKRLWTANDNIVDAVKAMEVWKSKVEELL